MGNVLPLPKGRRLPSWIEGAITYTNGIQSPFTYRLWAALSTVAAALQRRVWTRIQGQMQFPNMYVILVGPPGTGKGNAMKPMRELARAARFIHIAPDSITKRALYDHLAELTASTVSIDPETNTPILQAALTAYVDELGVFVEARDLDFMVALSNLYDNLPYVHHKTAHHGEAKIENVCFNMIGGCTSSWIRDGFTTTVLEQGFPARLILVFSDEEVFVPLFSDSSFFSENERLAQELIIDLEAIGQLKGEMRWHRDAASFFQEWVAEGMNPKPGDPRLAHYCRRRITHVTKLTMILSAARRQSLELHLEDLVGAIEILKKTEAEMVNAVKEVGANELAVVSEKIVAFVRNHQRSKGIGVLEYILRQVFFRDIRAMEATAIFDSLIQSKKLHATGIGNNRLYTVPGEGEKR